MKLGLQSTLREEINKFNLNFLFFPPKNFSLHTVPESVFYYVYYNASNLSPTIYIQQLNEKLFELSFLYKSKHKIVARDAV